MSKRLSAKTMRRINWLGRNQIVELLESVCIACYDSESTDELREALQSNIEDGTIDPSLIDGSMRASLSRCGPTGRGK